MKKRRHVILSLVMAACVSTAITACGNEKAEKTENIQADSEKNDAKDDSRDLADFTAEYDPEVDAIINAIMERLQEKYRSSDYNLSEFTPLQKQLYQDQLAFDIETTVNTDGSHWTTNLSSFTASDEEKNASRAADLSLIRLRDEIDIEKYKAKKINDTEQFKKLCDQEDTLSSGLFIRIGSITVEVCEEQGILDTSNWESSGLSYEEPYLQVYECLRDLNSAGIIIEELIQNETTQSVTDETTQPVTDETDTVTQADAQDSRPVENAGPLKPVIGRLTPESLVGQYDLFAFGIKNNWITPEYADIDPDSVFEFYDDHTAIISPSSAHFSEMTWSFDENPPTLTTRADVWIIGYFTEDVIILGSDEEFTQSVLLARCNSGIKESGIDGVRIITDEDEIEEIIEEYDL